MTLIVAFGNKAHAGKDCAGCGLVGYYDHQRRIVEKWYPGRQNRSPIAKVYKFADELYRECEEQYGMVGKDPVLLQRVGLERRRQDSGYWVNKTAALIEFDKPDIAVITDVRFLNEALFVKMKGGILINVQRVNADGTAYVADDRPADHQSEIELDKYHWDFYIKAHSGEAALLADMAVTICEFERGRRK